MPSTWVAIACVKLSRAIPRPRGARRTPLGARPHRRRCEGSRRLPGRDRRRSASPLSMTHAARAARTCSPSAHSGSAHGDGRDLLGGEPDASGIDADVGVSHAGELHVPDADRVRGHGPRASQAHHGEVERFTHRGLRTRRRRSACRAPRIISASLPTGTQRRVRVLDRVGDRDANELRTRPALRARHLGVGPGPLVPELGVHGRAVVARARLHARRDVSGLDDHDADPEVRELVVHRLGERLERVLRRRVRALERRRDPALHRAHVHEHARAARATRGSTPARSATDRRCSCR